MNKEEVSTTISELWQVLHRAGLILGLLLGGLLWLVPALLMILMSGMPIGPIRLSLEQWIGIIVPGVIIIGSVAIAWRWQLIGAILLITEGSFWLILKLTPIAYDLSYLPSWISLFFFILKSMFSLILLVPGILFLVSWLVRRRQLKVIGEVKNMIAGEMWIGLGIGMVILVGSLTTVQLGAARPPTVVVHYDGSGWSKMDSGTTIYLPAVWGNSPSDVFAVGLRGTIRHYDGSDWSKMSSGTKTDLSGVWGSSASDVFAVGTAGTILHYNGSDWSKMDSGTGAYLISVWGSSASDVFAVGNVGTILHYNGSDWSKMDSGTTVRLTGVWGSSASDVFVVGNTGTILHYDGSGWSKMDSGTGSSLSSVWGSSPSDVFAVGFRGTICHYDGSGWSKMSSETNRWFRGVWGSSRTDVFAVADWGTILHYDGSGWSKMDSGTGAALSSVWGSSRTDVFAVGGREPSR